MNRFIIIIFSLVLFGCITHKRNSFSSWDFYGKNKVINKIEKYDVYIHKGDSVYYVNDISSNDSTKIMGSLVLLDNNEAQKQIRIDTTERVLTNEENDIHIHLSDEQTVIPPNSNGRIKEKVEISESDIKVVRMTDRKRDNVGIAFTVIVILLLSIIIVFFALIAIIFISLLTGLSGCYVATMVYGSYEAPKVLILRRFRDRFLHQFLIGRGFIIIYYALSPVFVEKHQSKKWMTKTIKVFLDGFVFLIAPFYKE